MKKIEIYECYRTLLYAPIYHVYLFQEDYGLKDVEIEFMSTGKGDFGAMSDMIKRDIQNDSIPICIADPTVILSESLNTTDYKIITTFIDRLAIWLIGAEFNIEHSTYSEKRRHREHNQKLKLLVDKRHDLKVQLNYILKRFEIAYPMKAETTFKIVEKYFSKNKKRIHIIEELADLATDELSHLLEGRLVLTNSIWNCYQCIKGSEHEDKLSIKTICDFGSLPISFTGIITSSDYIYPTTDQNSIVLNNFLFAVGKAIEKLYFDPILFAEQLYHNSDKTKKNGVVEKFDFNFDLQSEDLSPLINRHIQYFADYRIYNLSLASNYIAWRNYLMHIKNYDDARIELLYNDLTNNVIPSNFMTDYLKLIKQGIE
jgi:hypothetical protein